MGEMLNPRVSFAGGECTCGRQDNWHLISCRALTAAVLEWERDASGRLLYRNQRTEGLLR